MFSVVEIYDATLRDRSQGDLATLEVRYGEGGWPGSSRRDVGRFERANRRLFRRARLASRRSIRRNGIRADENDTLVEASLPALVDSIGYALVKEARLDPTRA